MPTPCPADSRMLRGELWDQDGVMTLLVVEESIYFPSRKKEVRR
jgi:hypothetical protein